MLMKKRMAKLMSLVLTSAMIVSSPYAGGMEFGAVVYAAEADEKDGMILEAGEGKTASGSALQPAERSGENGSPDGAETVNARQDMANGKTAREVSQEAGKSELWISEDYTFDESKDWDEKGWNDLSLTTEAAPAVGTTLALDVLIPGSQMPAYQGLLKVSAAIKTGDEWTFVQSNNMQDVSASDFQEQVNIDGNIYYKKNIRISFGEKVGANVGQDWKDDVPFDTAVTGAVKQVQVRFAGYNCNYNGKIGILNATLENTEDTTPEQPGDGADAAGGKEWDFEAGIGGWENADWGYQYDGNAPLVAADNGKMKVTVDYSKNKDTDWSQIGVREWGEVCLKGTTQTTFDFYYDPAKLDGDFKFKQTFQYQDGEQYVSIAQVDTAMDKSSAADAENGLKKVQVTLRFDAITQETCCNVVLLIIGSKTSYSGDVYIDNLKISKGAPVDDGLIDVILNGTDATGTVSAQDGKLTVFQKDGTPVQIPLTDTAALVDKDADADTAALYAYLQAIGESDSVIYGHQNDTWHHAGSLPGSISDTKDVTGSISGVIGIDALSLTGAEYSASRYNTEIGGTIPETVAGNVKAAAELTNQNIAQGAIITLSEHMPNFSVVSEREDYDPDTEPSYAKYDFGGYTPGTLTGDCMNEILPGGEYNEKYNAYLDMIADFVSQVNGPVLFRPFHENTGSWFWWGAAFCQPPTYRNVWKYTVEYLRDTKQIHNLLYVYGPGSEAATLEEYGERYPGDDYVDLVGFDMYNSTPGEDNESRWFADFKKELKLVEDFAKAHGKLIAVTETGVANGEKALLTKDNAHKEWYQAMLDAVSQSDASYFLLWANFGADGSFYTPYVKHAVQTEQGTQLHGQELLQYFYDFFCDGRSIFAGNQKDLITDLGNQIRIVARPTSTDTSGYLIAPISGRRMLEATVVRAKVNHLSEGDSVTVVLHGKDKDVTIPAAKTDVYYEAAITAELLASLGEHVGTIDLCINGMVMDTVEALFNVQPPKEDPYEIDGFENYLGVDSMLNSVWATNKATGNQILLSLNTNKDQVFDGEYSMKFAYDETADGWAGATISKEVDWSDCDALQFYTIPDGKNQKVVVQITANDKIYEVYLNLYEEYAGKTTPLFVTIPFADFCERDADGSPKGGLVHDCAKVTSFGLWVNAIADSPAITDGRVSGVIYYDKITAVKSGLTKATFQDPKDLVQEPGTEEKPGTSENPGTDTSPSGSGSGGSHGSGSSGPWFYPAGNPNPSASTKPDTSPKPEPDQKPDPGQDRNPGQTVPDTGDLQQPDTEPQAGVGDYIQSGNENYEILSAVEGKREIAYTGVSKKKQNIVIPSSVTIHGVVYTVTEIADNAFDGDQKLTEVKIPVTVRKIGNSAFQNCTKLKRVVIPNNVKTVGKKAFCGCKSLTSVTFSGRQLTTVGQKAFMNNTSLKKIVLPASVKIIRKYAFYGCKNLTTVQIKSAKITIIGKSAFKGVAKQVRIKVPEAKKADYQKRLKKSGYAGKIQ